MLKSLAATSAALIAVVGITGCSGSSDPTPGHAHDTTRTTPAPAMTPDVVKSQARAAAVMPTGTDAAAYWAVKYLDDHCATPTACVTADRAVQKMLAERFDAGMAGELLQMAIGSTSDHTKVTLAKGAEGVASSVAAAG